MAKALSDVKSIRNITFELCAWGWGNVENFGPDFGHLWRTGPDVSDNWESVMWNLGRKLLLSSDCESCIQNYQFYLKTKHFVNDKYSAEMFFAQIGTVHCKLNF